MRGGVLLVSLLFAALWSGCAGHDRLGSVHPTGAITRSVDEPLVVEVDCPDGVCPSAVGVLHHDEQGASQHCTAALVAPDLVLTAGHCLPPDRRAAGDSCGGVFVSFGATSGARAELRQCARIVGATLTDDPETLTPDYAILALDRPTERLPLALDPEPLTPGDVVTVISSSPDRSGGSVHSVRARRCVVDGAEAAARELGPRAHGVSWLGLCPIRPGNSGAPVLDALGKVRGLVHGGSAPFFAHAVMTPTARISSRTRRATPALP